MAIPCVHRGGGRRALDVCKAGVRAFSFFLLVAPRRGEGDPIGDLTAVNNTLRSLLNFLFTMSSVRRRVGSLYSVSPLSGLRDLLR